MRIPSEFHRDNLYGRENRRSRNGNGNPWRKIIRLAVALAVVIVVMRQAARPQIYEIFFPASDDKMAIVSDREPSSATQTPRRSAAHATSEARGETPEQRTTTAPTAPAADLERITKAMAARLTMRQRNSVAAALGSPESALEPADQQALLAAIVETAGTQAARQAWERALSRSGRPDELRQTDRQRIAALDSALENLALDRVVDGTVWRAEDGEAFYRFLSRSPRWTVGGAPLVGVLPLLQQPDVYRGKLVRVSGRIARAESIEANQEIGAAEYGVRAYWQLWLRLNDGSDRPLLAIVPSVTGPIQRLDPEAITTQGPQVTVLGKFLKRLAYRSAAGADSAPVVVGRLTRAPIDPPEPTEASPQLAEKEFGVPLVATLLVALIAGITLAVVAIWRTSRDATRLREVRRTGQRESREFLNQLASSAQPPPNDREHR